MSRMTGVSITIKCMGHKPLTPCGKAVGRWLIWTLDGKLFLEVVFKHPYDYLANERLSGRRGGHDEEIPIQKCLTDQRSWPLGLGSRPVRRHSSSAFQGALGGQGGSGSPEARRLHECRPHLRFCPDKPPTLSFRAWPPSRQSHRASLPWRADNQSDQSRAGKDPDQLR